MPLQGKPLTPLQIARLCYKHGIDPDAGKGVNIVNAICVAFGESSFYPGAWNFNGSTGDKSYGLWQINMIGKIGPERMKKYGLKKNEDLYSPDVNCKIMVDMSKKGTDFSPWGAYTSGSYRGAFQVALVARAALLKELKRPYTQVPLPKEKPVPMEKRSWVSYRQIRAASKAADGVIRTAGGDSSRDDVANYQRGLWKLLPGLTYMYNVGVFDGKTQAATKEFQLKQGWRGSEADGIPGPETVKRVAAKSELFRVRDF